MAPDQGAECERQRQQSFHDGFPALDLSKGRASQSEGVRPRKFRRENEVTPQRREAEAAAVVLHEEPQLRGDAGPRHVRFFQRLDRPIDAADRNAADVQQGARFHVLDRLV